MQAKNWRLMAFGCLMLSAGLAGSLVRQSNQGSITPWVVEVDHLGQAQRVAPANIDYQPTDAQIAYHLARFIEDVRGLPIARRSGSEERGDQDGESVSRRDDDRRDDCRAQERIASP